MKKDESYLRYLYIIGIGAILLVVAVYWKNKHITEEVASQDDNIAIKKKDGIPIIKTTDSNNNKKTLKDYIRKLKTEREFQRSVTNESEMSQSSLSYEEKRALQELIETTSPHYWDLAPSVLEDMHEEGIKDVRWQQSVEEEGKKLLDEISPEGTALKKIDCRTSLCLVQFNHKDESVYRSFIDGRMDEGPWIMGAGDSFGGFEVGREGEIESYIYFSKKNDADTFLTMRMKMKEIIDEAKDPLNTTSKPSIEGD